MAPGLTLDTGALIAADKNDRGFWRRWAVALQKDVDVTIPAVVLAQAWRGNSPNIARVLKACSVEPFAAATAIPIGALLAASKTSDVIDAAVAMGAAARGDSVLTSDPDDLSRLLSALGSDSTVLTV